MTQIRTYRANPSHLEGILNVQRQTYANNLVEDIDVFRAILEFDHSYVAVCHSAKHSFIPGRSKTINTIVGYLLMHPSQKNYPHMLNDTPVLPKYDANVYFINDLCILDAYRHCRIGSSLVHHMFRDRMRVHYDEPFTIQLISVNNTEPFWEGHGFRPTPNFKLNPIVKLSYGGDNCTHMTSGGASPRAAL
jgi:hypothetical protein